MTEPVKVKAGNEYEWQDQNNYITIDIPMLNLNNMKNIQIFLSDYVLRLTDKNKKTVKTLDFSKQVDYLSPENKFVLVDGVVKARIKKKNQQKWIKLIVDDISDAEIKARRQQSQKRYEQNSKKMQENKEKLKTQYDRMATKQLMRFEQEERKKLQKRQQEQKQSALNQVFRNVNNKTGKIQYEGEKWNKKGDRQLQRIERQEQEQRNRQKQEKRKNQEKKLIQVLSTSENKNKVIEKPKAKNNSSIFTQQDIQKQQQFRQQLEQQIEQIPVRKQAKVGIKFTQKLYPNVATRDYHYTEPPMPKNSVPLAPPREGDLQNRNPLWLKDRGDRFMSDKNYPSALQTYSEALKIDPSQTKILMNRCLANMKLFNLDSAIYDCDTIINQMQSQIVKNQNNSQQALQDMVKTKLRKGMCLAWKGRIAQSRQILKEQLNLVQNQEIRQQIQSCLQVLRKREDSHQVKQKGDQAFKRGGYEEAINIYEQSIQIDKNQYSLSNKCLCLNKIGRFQQSLATSEQTLKSLQIFSCSDASKQNSELKSLLIKLLYRKSTAQQGLKLPKQSQKTLIRAQTLNPQDKDIKTALQNLKKKQSQQQYLKLKEQASLQLTKNNNPKQALNLYAKCLKLAQGQDMIHQYLSILQNTCVCYLKLQQFDSVIATSTRIITIVNNIKSKIVQFGHKHINNNINKTTLNKILVRTFMRRANAYLQTQQIYNAKSDLERAQELEPTDKSIGEELAKIVHTI